MSETTATAIWTVIIGMALTNFALRYLPLAVLSRVKLPAPFLRWLSFVPISVMGALVASEVLRPGGSWTPPLGNPGIAASALTMAVFALTRSFLGATLAGMASFVALSAFM